MLETEFDGEKSQHTMLQVCPAVPVMKIVTDIEMCVIIYYSTNV